MNGAIAALATPGGVPKWLLRETHIIGREPSASASVDSARLRFKQELREFVVLSFCGKAAPIHQTKPWLFDELRGGTKEQVRFTK